MRRPAVVGSVRILTMEVDGFYRGSGGIFSFSFGDADCDAYYAKFYSLYARGVAVCGADFYINRIKK